MMKACINPAILLVASFTLPAIAVAQTHDYDSGSGLRDIEGIWYYLDSEDNTAKVGPKLQYYDSGENSRYYADTYSGEITIPETVAYGGKAYTVDGFISPDIFTSYNGTAKVMTTPFENSDVTVVELPKTITSICDYCFMNATKLTRVEYSDEITNIGNYAFNGCTSLKELIIPGRTPQDGVNLLPDKLQNLMNRAFYNCTALESIRIPASMKIYDFKTKVGWGVETFMDCNGLKTVVIEANGDADTNKTIGVRAFENCHSLTQVSISEYITSFGQNCFALTDGNKTSSLRQMYFPGRVPPTQVSSAFQNFPTQIYAVIDPNLTAEEKETWRNWIQPPFVGIQENSIVGVDTVVDLEEDVPAEYFTISGMKVDDGNMAPGIYIERKGFTTRKIAVVQ